MKKKIISTPQLRRSEVKWKGQVTRRQESVLLPLDPLAAHQEFGKPLGFSRPQSPCWERSSTQGWCSPAIPSSPPRAVKIPKYRCMGWKRAFTPKPLAMTMLPRLFQGQQGFHSALFQCYAYCRSQKASTPALSDDYLDHSARCSETFSKAMMQGLPGPAYAWRKPNLGSNTRWKGWDKLNSGPRRDAPFLPHDFPHLGHLDVGLES